LMARDFGGKRLAQVIAALAVSIAPLALITGTMIQYMSFDYLWWVVLSFFVVRLLRTQDARWWLGIGCAIGLGAMTKYTIAFFVAGLIVATLVTSNRRYLRSRWLWMGVGVAILIFLPNLIWQVQHHFISLDFLASIHARDIQWGRADSFLIDQLYGTTNPFTLPLWIMGLVYCAFFPAGKQFRAIPWMFLTTFLLLLAARGRSYYVAPAYPMLLAAGSACLEMVMDNLSSTRRTVLIRILTGILVLGAVFAVLLTKPITPIHSPVWEIAAEVNDVFVEMIGWQELPQDVAKIYANIPEGEKSSTVVLAGNYGEAGALELYGAGLELPRVISGSNSMWERGYGSPEPETVIAVGFHRQDVNKMFKTCEVEAIRENRFNVDNEESYLPEIFVCRQPRYAWKEMWQYMRWYQ